jgi:hypothetical protein
MVLIAANVQGFLLCWYSVFLQPEQKPNRITDADSYRHEVKFFC